MKKNYFFLLFAMIFIAGNSRAQVIIPCGTVQMYKQYKQQYPQIAVYEKQLEDEINTYYLSHQNPGKYGRKTASTHDDTDYYDIPVVVHVNHNFGVELLPDNKIYNLIAEMNKFYSQQNDVSAVVPEFKKYIGKAKFRFHLASKDPQGNPTKGITHHLTYLTYGGDDNAKIDQWPPNNYVNIWFDNVIGQKITNGIIVAYATQPPSAAANPFSDGIISNYQFIDDAVTTPGATGGSIDHEMGHIMNLFHTFGNTNDPGPCPCADPATNFSGYCGDDDGVDDTPPTDGCLGCCNLYDTVCSQNYYKVYSNINGGDSLVNYPDTANEQNIMNYANCKLMFTKGQVERMRAALNSDVGHRDSLWSPYNLYLTGALTPQDLPPVTDYSVKSVSGTNLNYFTCPGTSVKFTSACWNDTITNVSWTFNNLGPTVPTASTSQSTLEVTQGSNPVSTVTNSFSGAGWVSMTLAATGNNTGTTTTTYPRALFVADVNATQAAGYYQEFGGADTAKWPMFNYYNNEFKWQMANVGFDDNNSIEYVGYDYRYNPFQGEFPLTGTPLGDFDDFYSMPMDFTSFGSGACNLNYYYSGASRSNNTYNENDTLEIDYSADHGVTWVKLSRLGKAYLDNVGAVSNSFTPASVTDWAPMSIPIPTTARTAYTVFRFRYYPSVSLGFDGNIDVGLGSYSSGNNFYLDRINFSAIPATVNSIMKDNLDVAVVPNPTSGDAYVIIKDADYATAKIVVTDVTGKAVYTTTEQLTGSETSVQIPHSAISVKGIYLVQTVTGNQVTTKKLVVY
jgi:pregnancy-associated plasma protein-A/type IX secretion system substrate protein